MRLPWSGWRLILDIHVFSYATSADDHACLEFGVLNNLKFIGIYI